MITIYEILTKVINSIKVSNEILSISKTGNEYTFYVSKKLFNTGVYVNFGTNRNYYVKQSEQRFFKIETTDNLLFVEPFPVATIALNFKYGSVEEISQIVNEENQQNNTIYPLIAMLTNDIPASGTERTIISNLDFGIFLSNNKELRTSERLQSIISLNEYYVLLCNGLLKSKYIFNTESNLTRTKRDRFKYNVLSDSNDALEVNFTNIII